MLGNLRGVSPLSETMSEGTLERNRVEKALINKTPSQSQSYLNKTNMNVKNYSDRNGNDVTKSLGKGRKTFAFWTLVCLLFVLAIGNLVLTFTILAVLRLGHGKRLVLINMFIVICNLFMMHIKFVKTNQNHFTRFKIII